MRPSTQAVHAGRPPHEPDQPLNTPITMASTYVAGGDLEYGRYANPTWTAFEDALGALEGGRCLAFSSGLAAVATILPSAALAERIDDVGLVAGSGNGTNNRPAFWGNVGVAGKFDQGSYLIGVGGGFLPDQGGPGATHRGEGHDLSLYTAYFKFAAGRFGLMAEYLMADVEAGAALDRDAMPRGFYIRPSFMITEKLEAVARYSFLDSDGRGVDLADGVRSAPGGGTMDRLSELYFGGNWYLNRNDLKFSLGALYAKSRNALNGDPAAARVYGLRSQMQVNFWSHRAPLSSLFPVASS